MIRENLEKYHTFFTTPVLAMGQNIPGESDLRINESAARARAGLLNIIAAVTMYLLIVKPELDPIIYVGSYVVFDMAVSAIFGRTPLSPSGLIGTALTMKFDAVWKPIKPKRFAWTLGIVMGIACITFRLLHVMSKSRKLHWGLLLPCYPGFIVPIVSCCIVCTHV